MMLRTRACRPGRLLISLLVVGLACSRPAGGASATAPAPLVGATPTWPRLDVPTLLNYELAQFEDLSRRTLSVKDYGAKGDGFTEDTAAVQNAVNAANGGTLYFPPGTYIISSVSFTAGVRVRLLGAGQ